MRSPRRRTITSRERLTPADAMARAVELAMLGPAHGPNPQVGCVITSADGEVLGEGYHRGAGTAHAEVAALAAAAEAGNDVAGATAYVTLEPCRHTGRTGPCSVALREAGIGAVVYAVADPGDDSAGGARELADAGVQVSLAPTLAATALTRRWVASMTLGRPWVIAKFAATLDGRTAAADGTSFWITGEVAREHAHAERAAVDAIVVGTGTVVADAPSLTARPGGEPAPHQPLRVVVGLRDVKLDAPGGEVLQLRTHNVAEVVAALAARDARVAIVEGGATLMTAFFAAGLVDEVHAYIAPTLLGAGTAAVGDIGIATMSQALRLVDVTVTPLGADTLVAGRVPRKG